MRSYEIWLKGGGSLNGTMNDNDAIQLQKAIKQQRGVFYFVDGDNDEVSIIVNQIAVFACREDINTESKIGFELEANNETLGDD